MCEQTTSDIQKCKHANNQARYDISTSSSNPRTKGKPKSHAQKQCRCSHTNLLTITGYSGVDPEAGTLGIDNNLYPRSRNFLAGVNITF